jgi:hypothetical protein
MMKARVSEEQMGKMLREPVKASGAKVAKKHGIRG